MKIILSALYKGGIGKTYQNVLLSRTLSERGFRVLFLDFDSQMNGTTFLTNKQISDPVFKEKNIFRAIRDENLGDNIVELNENLHYVPGSKGVNQFETIMNKKNMKDRHMFIKGLLFEIYKTQSYDFVVMDMSPSTSPLNTSVMSAASHHIIMTQSEYFSMQMVPQYIHDIQKLQKEYGVKSKILGISVGMLDARSSVEKKVIATIKNTYADLVFDTIIKRKAALKRYAAEGYPTKMNKPERYALQDYNNLTDEVLIRLGYTQKVTQQEKERA
ncbi:ParA family protein [Priestia filamentosa]|uniref:ParA family protein n=1 Tax=Priestia filamentosa TaxID=1402861 RepID=UPI0005894FAB